MTSLIPEMKTGDTITAEWANALKRGIDQKPGPKVGKKDGNAAYVEIGEMLDIAGGAEDPNAVANAVAMLRADGVEYAFIDCGTAAEDGSYSFSEALDAHVSQWLDYARTSGTGIKSIATLNGRDWTKDNLTPEVLAKIADEALSMLWNYGFSGVQIDFEPFSVEINDDVLIPILRAVRGKWDENEETGAHLSVALPVVESGNISADQISRIGEIADMLNPMIYDTQGPSSWKHGVAQTVDEYRDLYEAEVLTYSSALEGTTASLHPSVPAYGDLSMDAGGDESWPVAGSGQISYHLDEIENVPVALDAIRSAVDKGADVDGVAIFWYPSLHYSKFEAHREAFEELWIDGKRDIYTSEFDASVVRVLRKFGLI